MNEKKNSDTFSGAQAPQKEKQQTGGGPFTSEDLCRTGGLGVGADVPGFSHSQFDRH